VTTRAGQVRLGQCGRFTPNDFQDRLNIVNAKLYRIPLAGFWRVNVVTYDRQHDATCRVRSDFAQHQLTIEQQSRRTLLSLAWLHRYLHCDLTILLSEPAAINDRFVLLRQRILNPALTVVIELGR
jgi:hypothetical protein